MALVVADRVQETTTTTGQGTVTLAGAAAGYQSFAVIGNGNTTYYTLTSGNNWEVGIGTYTLSGTTLARTTVLASSAGGTTKITLSGTSNVFVTYPADKALYTDASGNAIALGTPASGTITNLTGTASININGTVGATTPGTGAFTTATGTSFNGSTLAVPTEQIFDSGSSATYTTPANVRQIKVRMVGGGAGGSGSGASADGTTGAAGGTTTFKDVTALGGIQAATSQRAGIGGSGGSNGSGTYKVFRCPGGAGQPGYNSNSVVSIPSSAGGSSMLGGGSNVNANAGANSGGGGGGGNATGGVN